MVAVCLPSQHPVLCHLMQQKVTFGSCLVTGLLQHSSTDNLRAFLILYDCCALLCQRDCPDAWVTNRYMCPCRGFSRAKFSLQVSHCLYAADHCCCWSGASSTWTSDGTASILHFGLKGALRRIHHVVHTTGFPRDLCTRGYFLFFGFSLHRNVWCSPESNRLYPHC